MAVKSDEVCLIASIFRGYRLSLSLKAKLNEMRDAKWQKTEMFYSPR